MYVQEQNEKERIRFRLQQLNEGCDSGTADVSRSPQVSSGAAVEEFLCWIVELKGELKRLWSEEQKAKGLTIVIQVFEIH